MGGVPVLLMIAAAGLGITHGWQSEPNREGSNSDVRGTSVLFSSDRSVTGLPDAIATPSVAVLLVANDCTDRVEAASDHSPMAIPEIDRLPSIADNSESLNRMSDYHRRLTATGVGEASSMKPDPQSGQTQNGQAPSGQNGTESSGFGLPPSLSDTSLSDFGQSVRNNIDKAGREVKSGLEEGVARMLSGGANSSQLKQPRASSLIEPPPTRSLGGNLTGAPSNSANPAASPSSPFSTPNFTTPPFTGGESSFGRSAAVPDRTDPNGPDSLGRDNQWGDPAARQAFNASQNGRGSAAPTTDPVGSRQLQGGSLRQPSTSPRTFSVPGTNQRDPNGLRSNDTFGRPPAGLTSPLDSGAGGQPSNSMTNRSQLLTPLDFGTSGTDRNRYANPQDAPPRTEYERMLAEQPANDPQRSSAQQPQSAAVSRNPATHREATATTPDTRLSPRELSVQGWFVDGMGRVLDRNGYLVPGEFVKLGNGENVAGEPRYAPAPASQPDTNYGRNSDYGRLGPQPYPSLPAVGSAFDESLASSKGRWQDETINPGGIASSRDTTDTRRAASRQENIRQDAGPSSPRSSGYPAATDPPSYSDFATPTAGSMTSGMANGFENRPQVAAQPLFNGLLINSFVANVYLVFWLKNLRLQFRDKVAAQRMANSGGSAA